MSHGPRGSSVALAVILVLSAVSSVTGGTVGATPSSTPQMTIESTNIIYEGDSLTLDAGPGQVVRGKTNLSAGTRLGVRVESAGDVPFSTSNGATVTKNGTFRTTFDLTAAPVGDPTNVSVVHNGTTIASVDGEITECAEDCAAPIPASPTASIQTDEGLTLVSGPGQVISGSTNLPPGATVRIRIVDTSRRSEFSVNQSAVVGDDDQFSAVFDLAARRPSTPIRATVTYNGSRIASSRGIIRECLTECAPPVPSNSYEASRTDRNESEYSDLHTIRTRQGDTVRIELTFEPETTTLTIGGPQFSYALNLSVTDGNGDDRVTVLFATDKIGQSGVVTVANASDSVSIIDERIDGNRTVLDEGEYLLERSNGPLGVERDDDPETFIVERGRLVVSNTEIDEGSNESGTTVSAFGWPTLRQNVTTAEPETIRVRTDETVRIPIKTDELHATALTIGRRSEPYFLSATLRDGTGDERVVVIFNATAASENSTTPPLTAADDGDRVNVTYQNGSLVAGEYDTDLYIGANRLTESADDGRAPVLFGFGGRIVVAEGDSTPTMVAHSQGRAPTGSIGSVVALGFGGILGMLGIALTVGLIEL